MASLNYVERQKQRMIVKTKLKYFVLTLGEIIRALGPMIGKEEKVENEYLSENSFASVTCI